MKKIYDCFTFFNELDLLELRLEELYNHVDYFVIVESDHTFTNIPKPYIFKQNIHRFSKFMDKIRYIRIKSLGDSDPWTNERYQRNAVIRGCAGASENDIFMISDVDEIPRPSVVNYIRNSDYDMYAVHLPFFFYKFNFVSINPVCYRPIFIATKMSIATELGAQNIRRRCGDPTSRCGGEHFTFTPYKYKNYSYKNIHHGGWHFSYLGDNEFVKRKFVSFSHASEQNPDYVNAFNMESEIYNPHSERFIVRIDGYFPATILNNLEKYQKYIATSGDKSMKDYFTNIPDEL